MRNIKVFSGSSHPALAEEICRYLGVPLSPSVHRRYSNDNLYIQLAESVREHDVYIVQTFSPPVQDHVFELLMMANAARDASATRVTAVVPYYSYARSDKKEEPRICITGRLVADLFMTAGVSRLLTMDLHAPQVHGFFSMPVDHLTAQPVLINHFGVRELVDTVVVTPDIGSAKRASRFARKLGVPLAAGNKRRVADDRVEIDDIIGEVHDKHAIVFDDEIANAGTIIEIAKLLAKRGVTGITVACTHGVFSGQAIERLRGLGVDEIITTNTVPIPPAKQLSNLHVLSVAPVFGEAIRRINVGESVSAIF
ncbi:MAG TPA: ribose-phosphate pyrophosphokinase [Chloroflexota bacterium]|jgi:ribose-phosphate pyrophosphokinase|nr:ribose-phosphate pyrophosphokinase [Chloroflexota bacterium]